MIPIVLVKVVLACVWRDVLLRVITPLDSELSLLSACFEEFKVVLFFIFYLMLSMAALVTELIELGDKIC